MRTPAQVGPAVVACTREKRSPRAPSSASACSTISRLYGWSAKRSSAPSRDSSSRTNGCAFATISRIRASIRSRSSGDERLGKLEVVVEAVLDRRPDRVLRARGHRSQTAWAITCAVEWRRTCSPSGSSARTGSTLASPATGERQIDQLAVHARADGVVGKDVADRCTGGQVPGLASGQRQGGHGRTIIRAASRGPRGRARGQKSRPGSHRPPGPRDGAQRRRVELRPDLDEDGAPVDVLGREALRDPLVGEPHMARATTRSSTGRARRRHSRPIGRCAGKGHRGTIGRRPRPRS